MMGRLRAWLLPVLVTLAGAACASDSPPPLDDKGDTGALHAHHGGRVPARDEAGARAMANDLQHHQVRVPSPSAPPRPGSVAAAIRAATPGVTVRIAPGVYTEPVLVIDRPLTLLADSGAILDGAGAHTVVHLQADDVTVRGFTIRNTGSSQVEERAGIRAAEVRRCDIAGNSIENTAFGIYLAETSDCVVRDNVLRGSGGSQTESGNGIHAWSSDNVMVTGNDITGHRDGIYFEFVRNGQVRDNRVARSSRYGMHFMFSDDCVYERNHYRENGNGVAVMYSKRVIMRDNAFERSLGSAAYGLLLKDINDSEILGNRFAENSTALHLEGSNRNRIDSNIFTGNGLAVRLLANAQDNRATGNAFTGNAFDVGTNSRSGSSRFTGNYWDRYRGHDLDRDGAGDVPFAPVRLFALIVEQSPPALVLLRSVFVDLMDLAERVMPALTPSALQDTAPLMQPPVAS